MAPTVGHASRNFTPVAIGKFRCADAAVLFCKADGREDAAPRYRSWNKPHASPDPTAIELVGKTRG